MHLTIEAQFGLMPGGPETTLHVAGDVITIDDTAFDLSPVPEGGEGEWPDSLIIGPIRRIGGVLHVTVLAQMGATADLSQVASWVIENASGDVMIPAARKEPAA